MPIDLDAAEASSTPRPTARSASRRSSRSSTRDTLDLVPRFEELRDAAARRRPGPARADRRRADLRRRSRSAPGAGEDLADALARQRDARRRLFALARGRGACARRHGHAPVGRLPRAAATSTPSTTAASSRACSTSRGATTRSRCTSTSACAALDRAVARLRPPAPGAADAAGAQRELAVPRRAATPAAALGAHPVLHEDASRAAASPTPSAPGPPTATTSSCWCARSSIVEYTQVWWSVRPHFSFGTVEVRICDAQATAAESDALAALIVACVAQAARDDDEGVPFADPPPPPDRGELLAGDPLRAGRRADRPRARRGDPARAALERLLALDRAGARRAAASSRAVPALNGAQRQRARARRRGVDCDEVYAATVRETATTYAQEVPRMSATSRPVSRPSSRPRRSCAPPTRPSSSASASRTCSCRPSSR